MQPYSVAASDMVGKAVEFKCVECNADFYCVPPDSNKTPIQTFLKSDSEKSGSDQIKEPTFGKPKQATPPAQDNTDKPRETTVVPVQDVDASLEIKTLWNDVKENYEDENMHSKFIQLCLKQDLLTYASGKYRKILESNPSDNIAEKMKKRIIGLALASYVPAHSEEVSSFRLGKSGSVALFGVVLMMLGLIPETPRSLIVIGLLMFTIGGGIRFLKRH